MKKILIITLPVLILLGVGTFLFFRSRQAATTSTPLSQQDSLSGVNPAPTIDPKAPVKEFTVDGTNYAFSPSTITVNKGDTVKITFKDDDGRHNLVINGYNVATNIIDGGSEDSITFVADKTGNFEYYCSVGNHRDQGMTGTLVVNPAS